MAEAQSNDCGVCMEPLGEYDHIQCANKHTIHYSCYKKLLKKECIYKCGTDFKYIAIEISAVAPRPQQPPNDVETLFLKLLCGKVPFNSTVELIPNVHWQQADDEDIVKILSNSYISTQNTRLIANNIGYERVRRLIGLHTNQLILPLIKAEKWNVIEIYIVDFELHPTMYIAGRGSLIATIIDKYQDQLFIRCIPLLRGAVVRKRGLICTVYKYLCSKRQGTHGSYPQDYSIPIESMITAWTDAYGPDPTNSCSIC